MCELKPLIVANGVMVALLEADSQSVLLALSLDDGRVLWRRSVRDARYGQVCAASGMTFVEGEVPDSPVRFAARLLGDGAALWTDSFSSHAPQTLAGGRPFPRSDT